MKAANFGQTTSAATAFVSTNSICQGQQVPILWPVIFATGHEISFAHTSFKWANLASHNAGVIVVVVGISPTAPRTRKIFTTDDNGRTMKIETSLIGAYLVAGTNEIVTKRREPLSQLPVMSFGNKPVDGGNLLMSASELRNLNLNKMDREKFIRRIFGSAEFVRGIVRHCLWIEDSELTEALDIPAISERVDGVRQMRLDSPTRGPTKWQSDLTKCVK